MARAGGHPVYIAAARHCEGAQLAARARVRSSPRGPEVRALVVILFILLLLAIARALS
jgi:hypothetical protein